MTSVSAFNDMMGNFLAELHLSFPEEKSIKKYMTTFELLRSANGRLVIDGFMSAVAPHANQISAKDEAFFIENAETIDFLKDINFKKIWPIASANTREAIWDYIQTLCMLGNTIRSIPPDTLAMIEKVAKQCTDKLQEDGGDIDESQLMKSMQGLLSGMMKK